MDPPTTPKEAIAYVRHLETMYTSGEVSIERAMEMLVKSREFTSEGLLEAQINTLWGVVTAGGVAVGQFVCENGGLDIIDAALYSHSAPARLLALCVVSHIIDMDENDSTTPIFKWMASHGARIMELTKMMVPYMLSRRGFECTALCLLSYDWDTNSLTESEITDIWERTVHHLIATETTPEEYTNVLCFLERYPRYADDFYTTLFDMPATAIKCLFGSALDHNINVVDTVIENCVLEDDRLSTKTRLKILKLAIRASPNSTKRLLLTGGSQLVRGLSRKQFSRLQSLVTDRSNLRVLNQCRVR